MVVASKISERSSDSSPDKEANQRLAGIASFWMKAEPHLAQIRPLISKILPIALQAGKQTQSLTQRFLLPHYTDGVGRVMWNVLLVFFGGQFALTIMAIQAFQMTGSNVIEKSLKQMKEQFGHAMLKFQNDPDARELFDANRDGVVTLEEVSNAIFSTFSEESRAVRDKSRKLISICLRCIDPEQLTEAFRGFMMGSLAIIATLRSKLAKCISIGTKVGEYIAVFLRSRTEKALYQAYPEHKKWVDQGLRASSSLIGIIVSFTLMKVINSFNCALQGSQALTGIMLEAAHKRGRLMSIRSSDNSAQALTLAMVFVGVMSQIKNGFQLPWYLKLIMFPVIISENTLRFLAIV